MSNRVAELTASIAKNTAEVNEYLASHGIAPLSFDVDVPRELQGDANFAVPRDAAINACAELQDLLGGSTRSVFTKNTTDLVNLQAVCRFNIATSFPTTKLTATYTELSDLTGLPEPDVRRIVRGALTNHVFQEKEPGQVSHTAASRFLAASRLARQWVEMYATEMLPAAARMVDAMEKWPRSGEPEHVGYSLANATSEHCFDYMSKVPVRAERFSDAMSLFSSGPGYGPEGLLEYFAANNLTEGTFVDVGGSHGAFSIPLVRNFPNLCGTIQDRPEVVDVAAKSAPEDVSRRLEFMSHDFFEKQPVEADVYLLRWILHDWSDQYCIIILRALIPALHSGSRILIHEWIVPEPHTSAIHEQISLRLFDLYMRSLCNGKEREAQDWKNLVAQADSRFHIRAISQLPSCKLGIIDIEWRPSDVGVGT
ncbi:O-methyltransferase-domain-containing protein [Phaeosphaeria sp. MPI-PUGE-AT-0046c]|nr:O-methyltransferase-domain-containing protein [Phaeosphaeria sp. MPI-PUGE-AT-0046c]KAH7385371.1 O-methyltransferase-domain-containing protein [Phaeosphaeria sp. MPI-PUGE-AT-0046c]